MDQMKDNIFNLTVAKRICDGSVDGAVIAKRVDDDSEVGIVTSIISGEKSNAVVLYQNGNYIGQFVITKNGKFNLNDSSSAYLSIEIDDSQNSVNDPHYHKCKIEPIEYILANGLGFCEGNVVKYITRYKDKGGVDDLRKIKRYVDYLIDDLSK